MFLKCLSFFVQSEPRCRFPAAHCLFSAESEPGPSEGPLRPLGARVSSRLSTAQVRLTSLCAQHYKFSPHGF